MNASQQIEAMTGTLGDMQACIDRGDSLGAAFIAEEIYQRILRGVCGPRWNMYPEARNHYRELYEDVPRYMRGPEQWT